MLYPERMRDVGKSTTLAQIRNSLIRAKAYLGGMYSELAQATAEALDELDAAKADKPQRADLVIPATGWVNEGQGKYPYYVDVAVTGITAEHEADVTILADSEDTAAACRLDRRNNTISGAIRFRAASVPSAAMNARVKIIETESEG